MPTPEEIKAAAAVTEQPPKAPEGDVKPEGAKPAEAAKPDPRDAELKTAREEAARAKDEADRAKRLMVGLAQKMQQAEAGRGAPEPEPDDKAVERLREAIEQDPEGVLDEHFNRRMAPILKDRYELDARLNFDREREKIVSKHGEDKWKKYEPELAKFLEPMSLTTKAAPGAIAQAFDFVRLQHFDDEVNEAVEKRMNRDKHMTTEGGSSVGTRRASKAPIGEVERQIMKEYGMDEDAWRKYGGGHGMSASDLEE